MAGIRSGMGLGSLILISTAVLFMFFVVLSGVRDHTPLNKVWFLQADTSNIAGAPRPLSQWTYFYVCGDHNKDCGSPVPALPLGYAWKGDSTGAPAALVGNHGHGTTSKYYYYMWRFGWVFYLMSFVLAVFGLLSALLAPCSRLVSGLSGLIIGSSLFFLSIAAPLMTAVFVKARNHFHSDGRAAKVGPAAFGFTWGAWGALFLAMLMLFLGAGLGGSRRDKTQAQPRSFAKVTPAGPTAAGGAGGTATAGAAGGGSGRLGFWRRQRLRGGRGSFGDNESQLRVKDEYA